MQSVMNNPTFKDRRKYSNITQKNNLNSNNMLITDSSKFVIVEKSGNNARPTK